MLKFKLDELPMHVETSLTMENAIKPATKHVRKNLEISMKQLQNATNP